MGAKIQIRRGEDVVAALVEPPGRVTIDGVEYEVDQTGPGLFRVTSGDRHWTVAVAGPPEARWVSSAGQVAQVDVSPDGARRRKPRGGGADALAAPMPATVVNVLVAPGDRVKNGETLVLLEAMKMELAVRAPRDGVVQQIRCRAGELVQPGVALLELE